ncbi:SRPBCC family protein [Luteococcus sp. H138]|uniref:SRPBCC family protein n=1 Tax=unclassified Luteococcus TaxID=2639923 RepID=UPI00313B14DB
MTTTESLTVSRVIDAPAKDIFEVLTLPRNHVAIDASEMVRGADQGDQRLQAVGDVFSMDMFHEKMGGDYRMENHVTGLIENKLLAWKPAREGEEIGGWEWVYELEPEGAQATKVSLTYDWSEVRSSKFKSRFPILPAQVLEDTLAQLASRVSEK